MKKIITLSLLTISTLFITFSMGCVSAPFVPPIGTAYTNIAAPLSTDYSETDLGSKSGIASRTCFVGLLAFGDSSVEAAAAAGGITKVNHVDYLYKNILGIYQETSVVVYGD